MGFFEHLQIYTVGIAVLGVAVGVVLGATGAGGAILSVPLLTMSLGLTMTQAAPISLLAIAVAAGVAAVNGLRVGLVRYRAAVLMSCLGLLAAPLGVYVAHSVPNEPLVILFALVLVWVAIRMWGNQTPQERNDALVGAEITDRPNETQKIETRKIEFSCEQNPQTGQFLWTLPCARALAITGSIAGFFSGLIGVGGGFIIVPALKTHTTLTMNSVVATSLTVIALVSTGGVLLSAATSKLDWAIGLPFTCGTLLGMLAGQFIARQVAQSLLSKGFACMSLALAIWMSTKVF
jgi:uncharacterized membrane protein YfcA